MSNWRNWDDGPHPSTFDDSALTKSTPPDKPTHATFVGELAASPDATKPHFTTFEESAMDETKPIAASKINWTALLSTIAAATSIPAFNDPIVQQALVGAEHFIPVTWLPWVVIGCNVAIFVFRTFFTGKTLSGVVSSK